MTSNTIVIVHGESERILVKDISRRLRFPVEIYPEKGAGTVDLPNVASVLTGEPFDSEQSLHKYFPRLDYHPRRRVKMPDLKIFPIIDVDQHGPFKKSFCSGDLFRDSVFRDRVIPIINDPDLDVILKRAGLDIDVRSKVRSYSEALVEADYPALYEILKQDGGTGLDQFLLRALGSCPPYQARFGEEYRRAFGG
ncbi:MAG: hypothetical protein MJZ38_02590 [archaeon]|nr:hypothetical protein [archaeon]